MIESPWDTMKDEQTAKRYKMLLTKIYNRSNSGLYYNTSASSLKEVLKDIEKLIKDADLK